MWLREMAAQFWADPGQETEICRIDDAAYGLRWLAIAHDLQFDPSHSLERQLPRDLLDTNHSHA